MDTIITISRQFGSGGRVIGKKLAEKLGIPYYDKEIIDKAAEVSGFAKEFIEGNEQKMKGVSGFAFTSSVYSGSVWSNMENFEAKIFAAEMEAIESIAKNGSCIIVGRCADFILKNKCNCLNVFIHSSKQNRVNRILDVYKMEGDVKKTEKLIKDMDKQRARHYKYYTDSDWGDVSNYHLSLDSGEFGIDGCVDIIEKAYLAMKK